MHVTGNGNYTVSLAQHFQRVLGVERNVHLVEAASWNLKANGVADRALVIASPSETFAKSVLTSRTYRHKPGSPLMQATDSQEEAHTDSNDGAAPTTHLLAVSPPASDASGASAHHHTQHQQRQQDMALREANHNSNVRTTTYNFNSVLCDPPRQGLDDDTIRLVSAYGHIIYISCNPEALLANMEKLSSTHTIERFAVFDHFPYSRYIECGVYLVAKQK